MNGTDCLVTNKCDVLLKKCVECFIDSDCATYLKKPKCLTFLFFIR